LICFSILVAINNITEYNNQKQSTNLCEQQNGTFLPGKRSLFVIEPAICSFQNYSKEVRCYKNKCGFI